MQTSQEINAISAFTNIWILMNECPLKGVFWLAEILAMIPIKNKLFKWVIIRSYKAVKCYLMLVIRGWIHHQMHIIRPNKGSKCEKKCYIVLNKGDSYFFFIYLNMEIYFWTTKQSNQSTASQNSKLMNISLFTLILTINHWLLSPEG